MGDPVEAGTTVVFLDTNILLHFKPVEDIPWPVILTTSAVVVVISRVTIQELDKQKNIHPSSKIRDRARRALKRLEGQLEASASIGKATTIAYFKGTPSHESMLAQGLEPGWKDDVLVATV